jgi:hypothetical protein
LCSKYRTNVSVCQEANFVFCYQLEVEMENGGRFTVPMTFLAGAVLTILLLLFSSSIHYPAPAQAAQMNPNLASGPGQNPEQIESARGNQLAEMGVTGCQVSQSFPITILQWCELITEYANRRGLDPDLLAALILQESGGDLLAYSHSGAVGLMQVMPRDGLAASFTCPDGPCFQNRPTRAELENPEYNIDYGTELLAALVVEHGNLRDALKSYGPMDVGYAYSDKVLALFGRYRD